MAERGDRDGSYRDDVRDRSARAEGGVTVHPAPEGDVATWVEEALKGLPQFTVQHRSSFSLTLKRRIDWATRGEVLNLAWYPTAGGLHLDARVRPSLSTTVHDWGQGKRDVERIFAALFASSGVTGAQTVSWTRPKPIPVPSSAGAPVSRAAARPSGTADPARLLGTPPSPVSRRVGASVCEMRTNCSIGCLSRPASPPDARRYDPRETPPSGRDAAATRGVSQPRGRLAAVRVDSGVASALWTRC